MMVKKSMKTFLGLLDPEGGGSVTIYQPIPFSATLLSELLSLKMQGIVQLAWTWNLKEEFLHLPGIKPQLHSL
jgi:hypothetical protein